MQVCVLCVFLVHNKTLNKMRTLTQKQFAKQWNIEEKFEVISNLSGQQWAELAIYGGYVEIFNFATRTRETIKVTPNAK